MMQLVMQLLNVWGSILIEPHPKKGVNQMKHNLLYISCPICGKQLIELSEDVNFERHYYWCDECKIDIRIEEDTALGE